MIPLILQLKNFLSYGPELQTIDFGPYPLICLSGKNGHGKSALLDAITWALWGQARKTLNTVKPDQGLLRVGQTHMMVLFDFELNNNKYRVKREFSLSYGKAYAQLEFGVFDQEQKKIIPLSSKTIRTTQEVIEQTIHIDFNSFINSAFLRQGNSNEFSKKSSKDRKEVLSSILGLDQYELLKKRALEKTRAALVNKQSLEMLQEKLLIDLQKKNDLQTTLITINQQLSLVSHTEQQLNQEIITIELAQKAITQKQHDAALILFHVQELIKQQNNEKELLKEKYKKWRTIHKQQLHASDNNDLTHQKKTLSQAITIFQKKLHDTLALQKQHLDYTTTLNNHIQTITLNNLMTIQKTTLELESVHLEHTHLIENQKQLLEKKYIYEQELHHYQHEQQLFTEKNNFYTTLSHEIARVEQLFERRKEYYQHFRARGSFIHNELQNNSTKNQFVFHKEGSLCPLCEQTLSPSQQDCLQKKYARNEQFLIHQRDRLMRVVKKLKNILIQQYEQIKKHNTLMQEHLTFKLQYEQNNKNITKLEASLALITQQINILETKNTVLLEHKKKLEFAHEKLTSNKEYNLNNDKTYRSLTATIKQLEYEIEQIAYCPNEHNNAQQQLDSIEKILSHNALIQQEVLLQEERKKDILTLCQTLRTTQATINNLIQKHHQYADIDKEIAVLSQEKNNITDTHKKCIHEKEILLQEKGHITAQQQRLQRLEIEYKDNQHTIKSIDATILDYQAIALATGKDGIQALLIEDAIPEIEHEANELLKKLTNNQAQIFIESLRDLKKGGTKETLDINISDANGIRPYELFSGGEAFKIDFALRIAISKLLARRAGTALQTLIIDEGFGSQDEEGLSHIMDVLHIIQNDFAKVIIVSHLSAMKNQFPIHFVVEKSANGSTVKTIEQD